MFKDLRYPACCPALPAALPSLLHSPASWSALSAALTWQLPCPGCCPCPACCPAALSESLSACLPA